MSPFRPRPWLEFVPPVALLVAGSLAFLGGGVRHPRTDPGRMGALNTPEFTQNFLAHIQHAERWEIIHLAIMAGPVLWALGAAALASLLPARVRILAETGRAALLLAAAAWIVAFVLDGFVAPFYARHGDATDPAVLFAFRANQVAMARLGTVSMVLLGGGMTAFAVALLATARPISWRWLVGALGVLAGGWPLLAAAQGMFSPGPFTSPLWPHTAVATALWFALLATAAPTRARDPAVAPGLDTDTVAAA